MFLVWSKLSPCTPTPAKFPFPILATNLVGYQMM